MSGELRRLARNAAGAYGSRVLLVLSVVALTPYLFRSLGAQGFGAWSVMLSLATVFTLLEVGFSTGITTAVARLDGEGRPDAIGATVRAGLLAMTVLGALALVVSAIFGIAADGLAAPADRAGFRSGLLALGGAMLIRFPCVACGAALQGLQRFDLFNVAEAVAIVGFAVGAVAVLESGGGLLELALVQAGALVAGGLLFVVLLRRAAPAVSLRGARGDTRAITAFGSWTLLSDSMMFIAERMDIVIVAAIRGTAAAGPYAAAQKLRSGLQSLTLPLFGLMLPMVSELKAAGRRSEIARRLVLATRIAVQVSLPVAAALALFAPDVVSTWLGEEAPGSTAAVIVALMAVEVLALAATPSHWVLIGVGRVRLIGCFGIADAAANLTLSIVLVSAYGAIGAALGTLFTSSLFGLVKLPLAARAAGCSFARLIAEAVRPALATALPAVAAMLVVRLLLDEGALRLALGSLVGLSIAAALTLRQIGPDRLRDMTRSLRAMRPVPAE